MTKPIPDPTGAPPPRPVPVLSLRLADAARSLAISPRLLSELVRQGRVPHLRLGTALVFPVGELERWLSEEGRKGVRR